MLDYTSYILSRSADLTVDASDLRTPTYSYVLLRQTAGPTVCTAERESAHYPLFFATASMSRGPRKNTRGPGPIDLEAEIQGDIPVQSPSLVETAIV